MKHPRTKLPRPNREAQVIYYHRTFPMEPRLMAFRLGLKLNTLNKIVKKLKEKGKLE